MNAIVNLVTSGIIAAWLVVVATLSIQNIQLVSLRFFVFESVELPLGVLLSFSVGVGLLLGGVLPLLLRRRGSQPDKPRRPRYREEDDLLENWEESP
ncbi:lipopolysaccharide assembly protein LapA domain-containing protein [Spirulina sp. CS-785/01]|uniref:lipopolysaccharide assembly protein LapA domain-containing protein n=1 Tax=Spirulina sp. CS-785/01 TaxID=3021716 RepID=UPI00232C4D7B|nr:lipopolysaccharide assembly protein LapA domain-containing protein [Spirulina sp. CS-785/01]MDB9315943.1 lipopolysaccharide assembly protein LapA domain-containing protein [Spirulina sp. CS-785/01]